MHDSLREMCQTLTLASASQLLPYGIQLRRQRLVPSNYGGGKGFET